MHAVDSVVAVPFPSKPSMAAMTYPVFDEHGNETGSFTAADVLSWRASAVGSSRGRHLFGSRGCGAPIRSVFQTFLRQSFKRLLPGLAGEISALVSAITPHSFRAGMASDLHRMGVPVKAIMKVGRWESERAMSQYIRDGLAQRLVSAKFSSLRGAAAEIARWIDSKCVARRKRSVMDSSSSSSSSSSSA